MSNIFIDNKLVSIKTVTITILLTALLATIGLLLTLGTQFKAKYKKTVIDELKRVQNYEPELLSEDDVKHLPGIVIKYIRYTGFMGREKIFNFRSEFNGGIRFNPNDEFMPLKSVQYNFTDVHSRLFYIVVKKKGIPLIGIHLYQSAKAVFKVRLLGLFTVVDAIGPKMDQGESVTVLNDMAFMAPGSLISDKIQWVIIDSLTVKANYTNGNIKVSANLFFNEDGRLINFISNDRYETTGKEYKNYPWETPTTEYKEVDGYRLPSKARLIYKHPEGDFCYGEFDLVNTEYNCKCFKWFKN